MEDIKALTDDQLIAKLKAYGQEIGPLTASTRSIFEHKLYRCLNPSSTAPLAEVEDIISEPNKPASCSKNEGESLKPAAQSAGEETVFYGVQLPPGSGDSKNSIFVFTDKQEALRQMKLFQGSRFKPFPTRKAAEDFSRGLADPVMRTSPRLFSNNSNSGQSTNRPLPVESSPFRSVKIQDLMKLRRLLETGDIAGASSLIWSNPRYLINSGDTPTILQEGFHYNALHVAAAKNQPKAAELILDTLENTNFMELLYPGAPAQTRDARIQFLVDLYLNTPEKGLSETPLHFACKFGHIEVVKVLISHPRTERSRKNKYGETPVDVICSRAKQPLGNEVKDKIRELLNDQYYVHLWRSEDNSTPPHVAEPWSPTASTESTLTSPCVMSPVKALSRSVIPQSPKDSPIKVKAFAGPMSATEAEKFHKTWLKPPCSSPQEKKRVVDIRRKDIDKGLERIGRHVAHKMNVPWSEYWEFLGCYADFYTEAGLQKLEDYLKERHDSLHRKITLENELNMVSAKLNELNLSSPFSSSKDEQGKLPTNHLGGETLVLYLDRSSTLLESDNDDCGDGGGDGGKGRGDGLPTDRNENLSPTSNHVSSTESEAKVERCDGNSTVLNMNADFWKDYDIPLIDDSEDGSVCSFHTAVEQLDSDVESLFTPPESPSKELEMPKFFIYGDEPSKMDLDVLRALEDIDISEECFPYITKWQHNVTSYPEEDFSKWSTPYHIRAASQYHIYAMAHSPLLTHHNDDILSSSPSFSPANSSSQSESSYEKYDSIRLNLTPSLY